ncbi:SAE2-domain-containing protein [Zopfia rhizophila CBS 207.26]|uniref:SAE2-domain-containing protein n=1 Tax=Zopfia rhizophila CBS 207.26 TaxID=1314779 RepID=A0A6A6DPC0_9PEZI|nr:SAE2-domain-containing protein [Zopfia rhizophila CBS 207.26]
MAEGSKLLEKHKELLTRTLERVSNEVIENLEKELNRRDEEHQDERKKRDVEQRSLLGHISELVVKNARLVEENSKLKHQLTKQTQNIPTASSNVPEQGNGARPGTALAANEPEDDLAGISVPYEEYHHLADKYNNLKEAHEEASRKLTYLEKKNLWVMEKNKEMKTNVKAWQEWYDHKEKKEKLKSKPKLAPDTSKQAASDDKVSSALPPSSPKSSAARSPQSFRSHYRSSPFPILPRDGYRVPTRRVACASMGGSRTSVTDIAEQGFRTNEVQPRDHLDDISLVSNQNTSLDHLESPPGNEGFAIPHAQPDLGKLPSSQTTEDEITTQTASTAPQTNHNTEDNDRPQFVSERSLKRKRTNGTRFEVHGRCGSSDGTRMNPYRVKEEQLSSPPERGVLPQTLLRKETLDLDELGPHVIATPHRRLRGNPSIHLKVTGTLRPQRSASIPLIKEELGEDDEVQIGTNNHAGSDEAVTGEGRAYNEPTAPGWNDPEVLQPFNPNVRATEGEPRQRRKNGETRLWQYRALTESGGESPPLDENEIGLTPNAARAKFNRRLWAAKNAHAPVENAGSTIKTPRSITTSKPNQSQIPTPPPSSTPSIHSSSSRPGSRKGPTSDSRPGSRTGPVSDSRPSSRMGPPSDSRPSSHKAPSPPKGQQPRLRSKPRSDLIISDFKPNPKYNHGYSYAFSETVRNRADRACLPGCTKPECCGSTFRSLAAAAPCLSYSQEEALLEDYLGDAYDSTRLTQMAPEEREELVLQARTRQMASKHGKHRQAYERHNTPPGFWRTDFPTTQEEREDRNKAILIERGIVEERWREAMRRGGRWMFRDE